MGTTIPRRVTADITYDDLYARWERGNWRASEIDFSADVADWHERLTAEQRRAGLWLWSAIYSAEDAVTDSIGPYIDAVPREEQKYFLATHQVDEARHTVMFHRFMREVVGVGDDSIASTLSSADAQLNWGYRKVFGHLDRLASRLRDDQSPEALARAVALYFVVGESGLGQPSQLTVFDALEAHDVLPGLREGFERVATDEHRHIAFGVKCLADLYQEHGEPIQDAIVEVLRDVAGWVTAVTVPPDWDMSYYDAWGIDLLDLGERGAASMERSLRAIGLPLHDIPGFPLDMTVTPRQRFSDGLRLLRGNLLGPGGPVDRDPTLLALLFRLTAQRADPRRVAPETTIQWDFRDADPWYVTVAGAGHAEQGRHPRPTLTLRCDLRTWADVVAGRADPRRLMLRGRIRARGSLRTLAAMDKLFG